MDFKEQVKNSFSACKTDISDIKAENIALKDKIFNLETQNQDISSKMDELLTQIRGLHTAIDYLKNNQDNLEQEQNKVKRDVLKPTQRVIQRQPEKSKDPYEALLAFKAKANKRDMLKQKLLSMVGEQGLNLAELKFMFVEHFKYCSKATFYNYLKELELEKSVRVERENSKNFIYLNSMRREI